MKELLIEQKAKAYDIIIEKANKMYHENCEACQMCIEELIPELESKDEKIRKAILELVRQSSEILEKKNQEQMLAWLEKQGEQKTNDKVEPKFHEGDWVIQGCNILNIRCVGDEYYCYETVGGYVDDMLVSEIDSLYHLWTIQDAKDGDVLSFNDDHGNDCIELIKSVAGKKIEFWFCLTNGNRYEVFDEITSYTNLISREGATPATKEQRDQLKKAMADAGYTFDFEKKELKKIEQKPVIEMKSAEESLGIDSDTYNKIVDECIFGEQNLAWSEEDKSMIGNIRSIIEKYAFSQSAVDVNGELCEQEYIDADNWLKSLKDRVQPQPKQEWSEEDDMIRNNIIEYINSSDIDKMAQDSWISWLKNIPIKERKGCINYDYVNKCCAAGGKPQSHWKPSEEQLKSLKQAARYYNGGKIKLVGTHLTELLEQLKAL